MIKIAAILVAILFPVFGRARENARRSSCQSNLKQMGLGLTQYTQDYDEIIPFNSYGYVSATDNPTDWMDIVQPYTKLTAQEQQAVDSLKNMPLEQQREFLKNNPQLSANPRVQAQMQGSIMGKK